MILRELEKAIKTAHKNMSNRKNTDGYRSEWRRRYEALLKIVEFVKVGEWADADEREKVIFILSHGYKAAGEKYGVSRTALSNAFTRINDQLEIFVPELTIRLIMQGFISAGLCFVQDRQLDGARFMFFPKGVLEILPEPIEADSSEVSSIIAGGNGSEFSLLRSLTVHTICEKLDRCDRDKLAKLLWYFKEINKDEKERQLELAELLMDEDDQEDW